MSAADVFYLNVWGVGGPLLFEFFKFPSIGDAFLKWRDIYCWSAKISLFDALDPGALLSNIEEVLGPLLGWEF